MSPQLQGIPSQPPASLSEFNDRLVALSLAGLSRTEFENLRQRIDKERLRRALPRCEFKNHGPNNDKGFSVEDQGGNFFIRVFARDQGLRAVPLGPTDAFRVAALLIRQLRAGLPGIGTGDLLLLVRAIIGRLRQSGTSTRQNDRSAPQAESTA